MSSLTKMLAVLDLFSLCDSRLTAEEIIERLGLSRTTGYRYLSALSTAGLLARFSRSYVLGPRAIELDQLIRHSDPLLVAAEPIMMAQSRRHGCDVQLLALAGGHVIVTHHVRSESGVVISYGRGRTTPPFQGAGAFMIAAALPVGSQRKLFAQQTLPSGDDRQAAWEDLRRRLSAARKAGAYISKGELDVDSVGIAAPIVSPQLDSPAAVVIVVKHGSFTTIEEKELIASARAAANEIRAVLDCEG